MLRVALQRGAVMLVSHLHNFIFLKTHKTGGTSAEMALEQLCAPTGHVAVEHCDAKVSAEGIVASRGTNRQTDSTGWTSHMPAVAVREMLGPDVFDRYMKVATVRNPFDKAVSWFHYHRFRSHTAVKGNPAHTLQVLEGDQLIKRFRKFIALRAEKNYFRSERNIDWHVSHIDGTLVLDGVLHQETLNEDLIALGQRLGFDGTALPLPQAKAGIRPSNDLAVADYYDAATADIVRNGFAWMFDLGGYDLDLPRDAVANRGAA
ncbi:sulfotransferase family 2 domain-containing protein [Pseudooceanicola nanhaiensis]|uniref:sulfotransferase family 2 domain-containing protein n=1 Tax=Pseudooceanicola nanhaiensis TaxID=375761 RepID=UPI001CD4A736|nr:sulfotransferase family 2 domain-containing protein [Pseudooceanicola nanhaiensis]MCA0919123.1 sulfotransferase family 2 domain-containing protein [Pseudooceanicola nanhaiensis]